MGVKGFSMVATSRVLEPALRVVRPVLRSTLMKPGSVRRILQEAHPILIVELHTPEQDVQVGAILLAHGYRLYRMKTGQPIQKPDAGWPNPDGIHGTIVAIHSPTGGSELAM
jgi:hypothetical protein